MVVGKTNSNIKVNTPTVAVATNNSLSQPQGGPRLSNVSNTPESVPSVSSTSTSSIKGNLSSLLSRIRNFIRNLVDKKSKPEIYQQNLHALCEQLEKCIAKGDVEGLFRVPAASSDINAIEQQMNQSTISFDKKTAVLLANLFSRVLGTMMAPIYLNHEDRIEITAAFFRERISALLPVDKQKSLLTMMDTLAYAYKNAETGHSTSFNRNSIVTCISSRFFVKGTALTPADLLQEKQRMQKDFAVIHALLNDWPSSSVLLKTEGNKMSGAPSSTLIEEPKMEEVTTIRRPRFDIRKEGPTTRHGVVLNARLSMIIEESEAEEVATIRKGPKFAAHEENRARRHDIIFEPGLTMLIGKT